MENNDNNTVYTGIINIVEIHRRSCRMVRASTSRASARISGRMNRAPPSAFSNQDWPTIN